MPPPARSAPEMPLLGPRSGKAVTPLDLGRFQSKVFRSVFDEMQPKKDTNTPKQNQEGGRRNPLQKEPSLQLDTPSRFLNRDQLFRPSFNVKVGFTKYLPPQILHIHSHLIHISLKNVHLYCLGCTWSYENSSWGIEAIREG